jgi:ABC-type sugar transport system ATPase subunit
VTIVEARGRTRAFAMHAGPVTAVRDVSLRVDAGDYVAIGGPSGCGKSTLLHLLGCVDTPSSGSVWFEGRDVGALSDSERGRIRLTRIGFVFQRFFLLPMLTAWENVELPQAESGERGRCSSTWTSPAAPITCRRSCQAAKCSASRSPERWPTGRLCCWLTSRRGSSTRKRANTSRLCSIASMQTAPPSSW